MTFQLLAGETIQRHQTLYRYHLSPHQVFFHWILSSSSCASGQMSLESIRLPAQVIYEEEPGSGDGK